MNYENEGRIKEILLCKYGEIILKGANRRFFEDKLCKELRYRAQRFGKFEVSQSQSTVYIEPMNDEADMDGMFEAARKVFGIVAISRCTPSFSPSSKAASSVSVIS